MVRLASSTPSPPQVSVDRLRRLFPLVAREAKPEAVHRLRTAIRRCEALLDHGLEADPKLRKHLVRLRRRAGHVRDLDVQCELLRQLHLAHDGGRQLLLESMQGERERRAHKLQNGLGAKRRRSLAKRLRRAAAEKPENRAAAGGRAARASVAVQVAAHWIALDRRFPTLSPGNLHEFRKECKRLRYQAEAGLPEVAAATFADALHRAQDAIGAWHDWTQLAARARSAMGRDEFGDAISEGLLAALDNTAAAHWTEALRVSLHAATLLRSLAAQVSGIPARRPPQRLTHSAAGARTRQRALA